MKFSLFTTFALVASAFAAPVVEVKRDNGALAVMQSLFSQVQSQTGAMNATVSGVKSGAIDASTASSQFDSQVSSIVSSVDGATSQVQGLSLDSNAADTQAVADQTALLIEELNGALNNMDSVAQQTGKLRKRQIVIPLGPLTTSLSALLLALEQVVDNLLAVVEELVNGILNGLNSALTGLTL